MRKSRRILSSYSPIRIHFSTLIIGHHFSSVLSTVHQSINFLPSSIYCLNEKYKQVSEWMDIERERDRFLSSSSSALHRTTLNRFQFHCKSHPLNLERVLKFNNHHHHHHHSVVLLFTIINITVSHPVHSHEYKLLGPSAEYLFSDKPLSSSLDQ